MRGENPGHDRAVPSAADLGRSRRAWGVLVAGSLASGVLGARAPEGWAGFTAAAAVTVVASAVLGGLVG